MSTPVLASMSASLSWKVKRSRRARCRPTAVLPEPMGPMRKMLRFAEHGRAIIRTRRARIHIEIRTPEKPPRRRLFDRPQTRQYRFDPSRRIFGVMKINSSVLLLMFVVLLKRLPEDRDIAEAKGTLLAGLGLGGVQNAAEHHGLAVVDQHLGDDLARVDRGHAAAGGAGDLLADRVVASRRDPGSRGCPA